MFLEVLQNSQEKTCGRISLLVNLKASACNFIKKETLSQVFPCEIFKNTYFTEHLWATTSAGNTKVCPIFLEELYIILEMWITVDSLKYQTNSF